ncbi:MAG: arginine N-succinyltransferase [Nitrosomonas sp.]|nr:arginine N-succinyltransferase [Nitrosomonas sp.]
MDSANNPDKTSAMHWTQLLLIVLLTIAVTMAGTYWLLKTYYFSPAFKPVALNAKEEKTLATKLKVLGFDLNTPTPRPDSKNGDEVDGSGFLKPEQYSEKNARHEISFTERELNALLARNTDLAQKLAIDLADDLVSAKLLVPLEDDFPVLGGKTLRVNAGIGMAYQNQKPVIILKGVSIMGIPIPNAWLGGLKNIDLVGEFGIDPGFWQSFAAGVEGIQVADGKINIRLKE